MSSECPSLFARSPSEPRSVGLEPFLERYATATTALCDRLAGLVYEVSRRLAREVVVLPVHQHVDPKSIETAGDRVRG